MVMKKMAMAIIAMMPTCSDYLDDDYNGNDDDRDDVGDEPMTMMISQGWVNQGERMNLG